MKTRTALVATMTVFVLCITTATVAEQIQIIGFNVEAGLYPDSDLETIARKVERITSESPVDLWGFSEVSKDEWPERLKRAAGQNFEMVLGTTATDRLLAVYNDDKFTLVDTCQIDSLKFGRGRAPLILHLKMNSRDSTEFLFMVNHLHSGSEQARWRQASGLNAWARDQDLPIITVGDYNFSWKADSSCPQGVEGYDRLTQDSVFVLVHPDKLIPTICGKSNKILDLAFVANKAKDWTRKSRILVSDRDCPDTNKISDHRPVELVIDIP